MSEDVARAVGAGAGTVLIGGKTRKLRPLTVRELTEVERECVRQYRRQYLETYAANLDLVPGVDKTAEMMRAVEKVARWDTKDLPPRNLHDRVAIKLTPALTAMLDKFFPRAGKERGDFEYRSIAAASLDAGLLTAEDYAAAAGGPPPVKRVSYVQWWVTGSFDGITAFIGACVADEGLTAEDIKKELASDPMRMATIAQELEQVSAPRTDFGATPA